MSKSQLSEDWYHMDMALPTPISVTHELLESGRKRRHITGNRGALSQVNFQSYDSKDFRLDVGHINHNKQHARGKHYIKTTYTHDYRLPYPPICLPLKPVDDYIDPIFNCRTVNAFKMRPHAPGKFMDDDLARPTVARKRKNFFRQLRSSSHIF